MMSILKLILASSSPRRRELLKEAGYDFEVIAPNEDAECGLCSEEGPTGLVADLAFRKAKDVRSRLVNPQSSIRNPNSLIVAADTVAECDGMILGKPRDEADARAMLSQLSGRLHRVLTGVCVWPLDADEPLLRVDVTRLRMDRLTDAELDDYLTGGGWEGKAGAFGYQDRLGWIHIEEGSASNVVGLPLEMLADMLREVAGK